jgi:protein dithiol oxidoreductase (disulfide-forming)
MTRHRLSTFVLLPALLAVFGPAGAAQQAAAPAEAPLVEGKDYMRISGGAPLETPAGQVEVAEMFNYACPACNSFNFKLTGWQKNLPAWVHMIYVPMDFRPDFVLYARAYYAAESLGLVAKSHEAVYNAIHVTHTLPGEGQPQDPAKVAQFYVQFGARADNFRQVMDSFAVNMKVANARQFAARSQVTSTPSLVIGGKYLVMGNSWDDILRNASRLIAQAHAQN